MLKANFIKKVASTLLVAGLVVSVGGTVTQAFQESGYDMSFDAYYGDEYSYSSERQKYDDSYGYVYLGGPSNYSVDFCMPAYDGSPVESIPLPAVRVEPARSALITNWVYENGYEWAVLRGRATSDNYYSVYGTWSPTTK